MNKQTSASGLSRGVMGTLFCFGLMGAALFAAGRKDYPSLHTILDTGLLLLLGILALLLWEMGGRTRNPLPKYLAVSFAVTAFLSFLHVMVTVEWSGALAPIAQAAGTLRPGTWPPSVHVLPIGVGCSVWLMCRGGQHTRSLAVALIALSAGMLILFGSLPRYAPPGWLGMTRPMLVLSPLLWLAVGWQCWRLRAEDPVLPMLALMSAVLLIANGVMLYSRAPHDTQAMVAHLFRVGGYLVLLLSLMQMAATDVSLEKSFRELNELRSALDEHAIVAITDSRGKITYVNDKFCAISKYSREELLGQDHRIINSSHHPKEFIRDLWTTIAQGRVWHGEIKNKTKDGSFYWVDTTIVPFLDEQGKPRQYVAIRADITERKRVEDRLRASFNEVNDLKAALDEHAIVAITDPQGRITFINDKFCAISKYSREELLGQDHRIINSSHHPKEFIRDLWTTIAQGRVWHGEIKNKAKDGSFYWVDTTIVPFLNEQGKPRQYVAIRADITERKRAEEDVRQLNAELEGRVRVRTEELAVAKERAESANQFKSEFLANMSHELRTPLNGIIGFSEFLVDEKPGKVNPKQKEYLNDVLNNGRHLLQLINDVLDLSKVEAGRMELFPEAFSVRKAIEEVGAVLVPMTHKRNISIRREVDAAVDAVTLDQQKFKQVLFNLLSNAVKFSSDGGSVHVIVTPCEPDQLRLQVRDTGIGIRPEDFEKLFVEFQQLDSGAARRYQGTGLGLALTKKIVEFQRGSIGVESQLGKGSTFTVILPRTSPEVEV